jgi:hypothetical protein
MSSLDMLVEAQALVAQAAEAMPGEADAMPTVDAGEVVAAAAERVVAINDALNSVIAQLQGQDPGDTEGADAAMAEGA